jgi:hypothetical protein
MLLFLLLVVVVLYGTRKNGFVHEIGGESLFSKKKNSIHPICTVGFTSNGP